MPAPVFDNRSERGLAIAKANGITENRDGSFSVPSQALDAVSYTVMNFGGVWVCDCPDYQLPTTRLPALSRPCTISGGDSIALPVCVSPMPLEVFGLSLSLISLAALVFTLAYSFLGRRTTKGGTAS